MRRWFALTILAITLCLISTGTRAGDPAEKARPTDNTPPKGFKALFNGKDLTGWQGLVQINQRVSLKNVLDQVAEGKLKVDQAENILRKDLERQRNAQAKLREWIVKDGILIYSGKGDNLQTAKDYGNFELYVDWKIEANGDSGIYLRGNPQVQIWDVNGKNNPKKVGSGGLYNNRKNPSDPLLVADNPVGAWNTFYIKMVGDKVTVKLNGKLVVDNTPLENYWEKDRPLPARGPIELQHHGDVLWFKNIYVKELPD
jgi:Domain of Unknown Function (DUF1080)